MLKLKNEIIKGLNGYMKIDVVPTDTADRKPKYPYLSYKVITPLENAPTFSLVDSLVPSETPGQDYDVKVVRKEQSHFTASFSAYSMNEGEACDTAIKAADWFKFIGYDYLKGLNIVVVSVTNVTDRTTQIVDDYEWRYGFDVRFRAARGVAKRLESINAYNFQGTIKNGKE